jgi:peptidase E
MINILLSLYNFDEDWCFKKLRKFIKKEHKVLIIPFSFHDERIQSNNEWQDAYNPYTGNYYKDITIPFLNYGIKEENIKWINYFSDTTESAIWKIKNSDIIFLTGGLPDKTIERLEKFKIVEQIENYNGVLIGSSAGAMVQIAEYHITPDKDYRRFSYNTGLNIIKDFGIEVHYKDLDIQNKYIEKAINEKSKKVYAIKDKGGIIINNGELTLLGEVRLFTN